jgi:hypothetical protein
MPLIPKVPLQILIEEKEERLINIHVYFYIFIKIQNWVDPECKK